MKVFYEIQSDRVRTEVDTVDEKSEIIRDLIEGGSDHICVIKWIQGNDGKDRSSSMTVYEMEDGSMVERPVYIHG